MFDQEISPEEAKRLIESGEATLLDVRTEPEYLEEHVEGAKWIPLDKLSRRAGEIEKEKPVILCFCRSGARSSYACQVLRQLGFKKLINVSGGILDWKRAGLKTVSGM